MLPSVLARSRFGLWRKRLEQEAIRHHSLRRDRRQRDGRGSAPLGAVGRPQERMAEDHQGDRRAELAGRSDLSRALVRAAKRARVPMDETAVHVAILEYLRNVLPDTHKVLHIPNAPRSAVTGAKLKRMGMMAGAPDLLVLRPAGRVAFIEVKAEGGCLTPKQREFREWCLSMGVPHCTARSIEDARDFLNDERFPTKEASL